MTILTQALFTFFLNACWQVALVAAFAMLGDWLLRGVAARARHVLWVSTLVLAFLVPLLSGAYLVKSSSLSQKVPENISSRPFVHTRAISTDAEKAEAPAAINRLTDSMPRNPESSTMPVDERLAGIVAGLLLVFFFWRAVRLFRAWSRTRVIVKSAYEYEFLDDTRRVIRECQRRLGARSFRIFCSASIAVPITVGALRPLIVLPERLLHRVEDELLTTAVGHELVHVARHDYLFNLIYEFIYLPLSFHPAAAFIRRRIKHTRELSCDEAVAAKLLSPEIYARSLVHLVGAMPRTRRLAADNTIGISESDNLEVRIMSLLRTRNLAPRRKRLLVVTAALLLIAPCIVANRFALAFEMTRPETTRPSVSTQTDQSAEQQKLEQARQELKRTEQQLKEQLKTLPEAQRADAEARLREVLRNLELHARLIHEFDQQRSGTNAEEALRQARENLERAQKERPQDEAALKDLRRQLADLEKLRVNQTIQNEVRAQLEQVLKQNPQDEARVRELRQKLAELSQTTQDQEERAKKQERELAELARNLDREAEQRARAQNRESDERIKLLENDLQARALVQEREREERIREVESRVAGIAAAGWAKIPMTQAIQIATSKYPGTVLQSRLLGEREDKVCYQIMIAVSDGDKRTIRYVWVNAIDGSILKTQ
jgi:beta-lactamase regulating signal transducer with metallopeptidase domain/uncharacterized membrane protein YkoI